MYAVSSRLGMWALILSALACCAIASSNLGAGRLQGSTGSRSLVSRRQLDELPPSTQPCFYDETLSVARWPGFCQINPAYMANQTAHSTGAKADIYGARYSLACAKHFTNEDAYPVLVAEYYNQTVDNETLAMIQECNSDKANFCEVILSDDGATMSCAASPYAAFVKYIGLCPGAPFTEYLQCGVKSRDECSGKCAWNTLPSGNEKNLYRLLNATNNGFYQREFCWPASAAATWKTKADYREYSSYIWDNNTARGDCKYARNAAARNDYSVLCSSFNDPSYTFGIMQGYMNITEDGRQKPVFNGINATLANQCLAAGCRLYQIPPDELLAWNPFDVDWFECGQEDWKHSEIGYYNRARDINLFRASRLCSMPELQFDYFACNAARIMPY